MFADDPRGGADSRRVRLDVPTPRSGDYEPTLPEDVARYYLREGGAAADSDLVKLVALAADRFLAGVVHEAGEFATLRGEAPADDDAATRVLRAEDVMRALERRGVTTLHGGPAPPVTAPRAAPAAAPVAKKPRGRPAKRKAVG